MDFLWEDRCGIPPAELPTLGDWDRLDAGRGGEGENSRLRERSLHHQREEESIMNLRCYVRFLRGERAITNQSKATHKPFTTHQQTIHKPLTNHSLSEVWPTETFFIVFSPLFLPIW